jgi:GTP-binding protein Era
MNNVTHHKAGFVNIIGNPNVGKSTLMNALVGEKLSIISPKPQTTRHRIIGIANDDNYQIIFSDTPGILKPKYKLQERMMGYVETAFVDADIFLFMIDANEDFADQEIINKINQLKIPVFLVINKIDLSNQENIQTLIHNWMVKLPQAEIFTISALHKFNIDGLLKRIIELLPEHLPYYSKEDLSDKNMRFFVAEIIREKILLYYKKEIPYSVEVIIESYKEDEKMIHINAVIYVERNSQKGIIIGHKGEALKKTLSKARVKIEEFIGKKVFLEVFVKVQKNWRKNDNTLKQFGYNL